MLRTNFFNFAPPRGKVIYRMDMEIRILILREFCLTLMIVPSATESQYRLLVSDDR